MAELKMNWTVVYFAW